MEYLQCWKASRCCPSSGGTNCCLGRSTSSSQRNSWWPENKYSKWTSISSANTHNLNVVWECSGKVFRQSSFSHMGDEYSLHRLSVSFGSSWWQCGRHRTRHTSREIEIPFGPQNVDHKKISTIFSTNETRVIRVFWNWIFTQLFGLGIRLTGWSSVQAVHAMWIYNRKRAEPTDLVQHFEWIWPRK